jgi:polar amino acid transport system substrate-binding protein
MLCGSVTASLKRRERVSFSIPIYNGGIGVLVNDNAPEDLVRVVNGEVAHKGPVGRATVNRGLASYTYAVHADTVTSDWVQARVAALGVQLNIVPLQGRRLFC